MQNRLIEGQFLSTGDIPGICQLPVSWKVRFSCHRGIRGARTDTQCHTRLVKEAVGSGKLTQGRRGNLPVQLSGQLLYLAPYWAIRLQATRQRAGHRPRNRAIRAIADFFPDAFAFDLSGEPQNRVAAPAAPSSTLEGGMPPPRHFMCPATAGVFVSNHADRRVRCVIDMTPMRGDPESAHHALPFRPMVGHPAVKANGHQMRDFMRNRLVHERVSVLGQQD